jgi:hypothetical protein
MREMSEHHKDYATLRILSIRLLKLLRSTAEEIHVVYIVADRVFDRQGLCQSTHQHTSTNSSMEAKGPR